MTRKIIIYLKQIVTVITCCTTVHVKLHLKNSQYVKWPTEGHSVIGNELTIFVVPIRNMSPVSNM